MVSGCAADIVMDECDAANCSATCLGSLGFCGGTGRIGTFGVVLV